MNRTFISNIEACNGWFHNVRGRKTTGMLTPIRNILRYTANTFRFMKDDATDIVRPRMINSEGRQRWTETFFKTDHSEFSMSAFPFIIDIEKSTRIPLDGFFGLFLDDLIEAKIGPGAEIGGFRLGFISEGSAVIAQSLYDEHLEALKVFQKA